MLHVCTNCSRTWERKDPNVRFVCVCGTPNHTQPPIIIERQQICISCSKFNKTRCSLYLRPCSTGKLWRGLLDPPEGCPNEERLLEL